MLSALLITFRETLEAALVVGIVFTLLVKTNQMVFKKYVFMGVAVGVLISVMLAITLSTFFGGFTGRNEQLFEGTLMLVTVGFLTWMILWVHRQKDIVKKIKEKVTVHAEKGYGLGIFFLVATSVLREGTESVLYLKASSLAGASNQFMGGIIGIFSAVVLAYVLFKLTIKVNIQKIFTITNIFLLLFASGLVSHGVHEFQEAGIFPIFSFDPLINVSSLLNHKEGIGSILRVLFGYTSKPTIFEVVSYVLFVLFIIWLERKTDGLLIKRSIKKIHRSK